VGHSIGGNASHTMNASVSLLQNKDESIGLHHVVTQYYNLNNSKQDSQIAKQSSSTRPHEINNDSKLSLRSNHNSKPKNSKKVKRVLKGSNSLPNINITFI
jgi:hypothetical protein